MDNLQITLKLPMRQVNVILAALGKQPLESVIEVFSAVRAQAGRQLAEVESGPQEANQ